MPRKPRPAERPPHTRNHRNITLTLSPAARADLDAVMRARRLLSITATVAVLAKEEAEKLSPTT